MSTIVLNCLVKGDLSKNAFPVRVRRDETIGDLKRAIKAEKAVFDIFGASDLKLWEVDTQFGKSIPLDSKHLLDVNELVAVEEIGKYQNYPCPIKGNLHVYIKTPAVITLNCRVSGYSVDTHYLIRIPMNGLVRELQFMIKKRQDPLFSHIIYDELKLMPIKEPLNNPIYSELENSMKSLDKISNDFNRFNYTYNPSHLHILVSSANWKEVHC